MNLEQIRAENKQKVLEIALDMFVINGIESTKIKDVAKQAGLTERSVFRYFPNKVNLVYEASIWFWQEKIKAESEKVWARLMAANLSSRELIEKIIYTYASQVFSHKKQLIFIQEAEVFLYRNHLHGKLRHAAVNSYIFASGPLGRATLNAVNEGLIKDADKLNQRYEFVFDTLLGCIQKIALNTSENDDEELSIDAEELQKYCSILTGIICG